MQPNDLELGLPDHGPEGGYGTSSRTIAALLFALLFVSFGWFSGDFGNPNGLTRLYLTTSILDHGTTTIDEYRNVTGDIAKFDDHYYADKAPGLSFMALVPIGMVKAIAGELGFDLSLLNPDGTWRVMSNVLLELAGILATGALLGSSAGVVTFFLIQTMTRRADVAVQGTLFTWLGTPLWGWSGRFFSHSATAALLFMGFAAVYKLATSVALSRGQARLLAVATAVCLSWACVIEFTAMPAAAIIFLYGLWKLRQTPRSRLAALLLVGIGGTTAAAIPLLVYNWVSFHAIFVFGYESVQGFSGMKQGFMGLTYPKPQIVYELLLGLRRGLLWIAPIVLVAPIGLALMWHRARAEAIAVASIAFYYLLFNSSYYYWDGGASTGPRHMTPLLPFLALPIAFALRGAGPTLRTSIWIVAGLSVVISLMCATVGMAATSEIPFPLWDYIIKDFITGEFRPHALSYFLGVGNRASVTLFLIIAGALIASVMRYLDVASPARPV
jgi:hypothetical protein